MSTKARPEKYCAAMPFVTERMHAAAMYCSDGRLGEACDEFLQDGLGLPRYDRLAVPGGAACLAGHEGARREGDAATSQLEFLVTAHDLHRVVLIAHEGCAFYLEHLGIAPEGLVQRQFEDLRRAAECVHRYRPGMEVLTYFAHVVKDTIEFERVE